MEGYKKIMKEGDKVELVCFNGLIKSPVKVKKDENFWILIGERGLIVKDPDQKMLHASFSEAKRYLVKFDKDIKARGLICHNAVKNSLWILETDLKKLVRNNTP